MLSWRLWQPMGEMALQMQPGLWSTGETYEQASSLGLDPLDFLNRNDSYHFFEPLSDLIKPGPTLTNVNDITFLFINNR
jgi:glycerate 2-kinase